MVYYSFNLDLFICVEDRLRVHTAVQRNKQRREQEYSLRYTVTRCILTSSSTLYYLLVMGANSSTENADRHRARQNRHQYHDQVRGKRQHIADTKHQQLPEIIHQTSPQPDVVRNATNNAMIPNIPTANITASCVPYITRSVVQDRDSTARDSSAGGGKNAAHHVTKDKKRSSPIERRKDRKMSSEPLPPPPPTPPQHHRSTTIITSSPTETTPTDTRLTDTPTKMANEVEKTTTNVTETSDFTRTPISHEQNSTSTMEEEVAKHKEQRIIKE